MVGRNPHFENPSCLGQAAISPNSTSRRGTDWRSEIPRRPGSREARLGRDLVAVWGSPGGDGSAEVTGGPGPELALAVLGARAPRSKCVMLSATDKSLGPVSFFCWRESSVLVIHVDPELIRPSNGGGGGGKQG